MEFILIQSIVAIAALASWVAILATVRITTILGGLIVNVWGEDEEGNC